jgi:hypothetical protein
MGRGGKTDVGARTIPFSQREKVQDEGEVSVALTIIRSDFHRHPQTEKPGLTTGLSK